MGIFKIRFYVGKWIKLPVRRVIAMRVVKRKFEAARWQKTAYDNELCHEDCSSHTCVHSASGCARAYDAEAHDCGMRPCVCGRSCG